MLKGFLVAIRDDDGWRRMANFSMVVGHTQRVKMIRFFIPLLVALQVSSMADMASHEGQRCRDKPPSASKAH